MFLLERNMGRRPNKESLNNARLYEYFFVYCFFKNPSPR
jgi:hypothetical protein